MKTIKLIKLGKTTYKDINYDDLNSIGISDDIDMLKSIALDTINWQAGRDVLALAGSNVGLSIMNAKSQAIIVKLLDPPEEKLASLTDNEAKAWESMTALAYNGYGDSQKLVDSLNAVMAAVAKATDKSVRVMQATTHEEVIEILNED